MTACRARRCACSRHLALAERSHPCSRYPTRIRQIIPPFSLWWVGMVHDYALWRGDPELVRGLLPAVRGVIDAFLGFLNADGLIQGPPAGTSWTGCPSGTQGIPPEGDFGASGLINWQMVWTLRLASELEELAGRARAGRAPEPASGARPGPARHPAPSGTRTAACWPTTWRTAISPSTPSAWRSSAASWTRPSRHGPPYRCSIDPQLTRTTIYFTHYLFETYRQLGHIERCSSAWGCGSTWPPWG